MHALVVCMHHDVLFERFSLESMVHNKKTGPI
jgi:hypothetical protein